MLKYPADDRGGLCKYTDLFVILYLYFSDIIA